MAEGFANHFGSDVLIAASAGLSPMPGIVRQTVDAMAERGIDISQHIPSWYEPALAARYDIVVNMSGFRLPGAPPKEVLEWVVEDPFMRPMATYRKVRDGLEMSVMALILRLRHMNKSLLLFFGEFLLKPRLSHSQLPANGVNRHSENLRGLFRGESAEEAHLDELGLCRITSLENFESSVECE